VLALSKYQILEDLLYEAIKDALHVLTVHQSGNGVEGTDRLVVQVNTRIAFFGLGKHLLADENYSRVAKYLLLKCQCKLQNTNTEFR
jgi:hypothetical protein